MNKITDLIVEIEREERVNDKYFKETLSLLYEANKHYNKALNVHGVVEQSEQLCQMCKSKDAQKEQLCNSCWGDVNA
tara:strand:+ start:33606 stop:33836 length:231 start_codon:yes stop_codon:yes gene_type:complete